MATESLLSEFPAVSTEEWERIIRESISGAEYASRLIWHAEEGLAVRPYYRSEDLGSLTFLDAAPGEFPYVRGNGARGDWRIREEVDFSDPEEANRAASQAIAAGAEEIAFAAARIETSSDIAVLLANLNEIPIHFEHLNHSGARMLVDRLSKKPHSAPISAGIDPLADLDFSVELLRDADSGIRLFQIHAEEFQERAAGCIEEIGFTLAAAVEFTAEMQERGFEIGKITDSLSFSFAMGPEFFLQIAKLRAFRMVWAQAVESFGGNEEDAKAVIHARTSRWNTTVYDPHVNILRATTEAISAILGGAGSFLVAPFDDCYRQPEESSRRLARNTQIVLKRESLLSRVADPLGGSYLIETLTNAIATKSWKLFQELERAGGFRKAKAAGIVDAVLERRVTARDEAMAIRRLVLTGTNRFAVAAERLPNHVDAERIGSIGRSAQGFEQLRIRAEHYAASARLPRILLAESGDAKMRRARSQFAVEFFACAGLASETKFFRSPEEIAESDADLVVLCSSDAEYLPVASELVPMLKARESRAGVVIAGNPDTAEQLRALGIAEFIHIRCNAVEVLSALQRQMGMED